LAVATSLVLTRLSELDVFGNRISAEMREVLRQRFGTGLQA
jgi:hypothetical protein